MQRYLSPLRDVLQSLGKKNPSAIIGFFLYFEPDREIENSEEPYELFFVVVHDHLIEGSREIAEQAAEKITTKLTTKYRVQNIWKGVELVKCDIASDEEFSLYNAMTYKNYPLDYISLRASETADQAK